MSGIPLRNKRQEIVALAEIDAQDHERVSAFRWHLDSKGYARTSFVVASKRRCVWMHRLILGDGVGKVIDHINRNRLDNRRSNLRHSTRSQNSANKKVDMPKTSVYKGVVSSPRTSGAKRYRASLVKEGKMVFSATYLYEDEAALAYDQAALLHFGEFARTNFLDAHLRPAPLPAPRSQRPSVSKHGYRGIYEAGPAFGAQIYDPATRKIKRLGRFPTAEAAAHAFDHAAFALYGPQAILNFPRLYPNPHLHLKEQA